MMMLKIISNCSTFFLYSLRWNKTTRTIFAYIILFYKVEYRKISLEQKLLYNRIVLFLYFCVNYKKKIVCSLQMFNAYWFKKNLVVFSVCLKNKMNIINNLNIENSENADIKKLSLENILYMDINLISIKLYTFVLIFMKVLKNHFIFVL